MRLTTIDLVTVEPGQFLEWSAAPTSPGKPSDIPLSANQGFHLGHLLKCKSSRADENNGWLAVTFEVPGLVRRGALTAACEALLRRHETLRCVFETDGGIITRRIHPAEDVALIAPVSAVPVATAEAAREQLRDRLSAVCDPTRFPPVLFAAVERPTSSTVLIGFDHSSGDAASLALAAKEVRDDYLARVEGLDPPELAPVGSFLDYCVFEHGQPVLAKDHPGMAVWRDFLAESGGRFPNFPLDLGVAEGELPPQRTEEFCLQNDDEATKLEQLCRAVGASLFTGELTVLAQAVHELGGPERMPTLTPLHTRLRPEWEQAVGWFVTNIPLIVVSGDDFVDGLRRNRAAFRASLPAAQVPIGQVMAGHAGPFRFVRKDIAMVSHVDYRKTPGPHEDRRAKATHISNSTVADDAQFWFSRTASGLWTRMRYPDTEAARATMAQLRELLPAILLRELAAAS
jgi:hypothetical protein